MSLRFSFYFCKSILIPLELIHLPSWSLKNHSYIAEATKNSFSAKTKTSYLAELIKLATQL